MQFSASFTSVNGSTEGIVNWAGIDVGSSSLQVSGIDVALANSSGMVSFELDGLTVIDFTSGDVPDGPALEVDPIDSPEFPPWLVNHLGSFWDPFS